MSGPSQTSVDSTSSSQSCEVPPLRRSKRLQQAQITNQLNFDTESASNYFLGCTNPVTLAGTGIVGARECTVVVIRPGS